MGLMISRPLKVYSALFGGQYIGGSAVIVATDKGHARRLLNKSLAQYGLDDRNASPGDITLTEIETEEAGVFSFQNGDY
jgi:hypothetical protein